MKHVIDSITARSISSAIKGCLENRGRTGIINSFSWNATPQGHRYWHSREEDPGLVTQEDLVFILLCYFVYQHRFRSGCEFQLSPGSVKLLEKAFCR
jgi:hypothetical protein